MARCRFQLVAIAVIASLELVGGQDLRPEMRVASQRNRDTLLRYVKPVLSARGGAGRLYFRADCMTQAGDGIVFPRLALEAPPKPDTSLAAIRDVFRKEKQVVITENPSGVLRISVGDVRFDLLQTKIQSLTLTLTETYNPRQAITAIARTREVQATMHEQGIEHEATVFVGRVLDPAPGLPHLPASIKNLTMDEALDRVAQTFGGLVMYGECANASGKRLLSLRFEYTPQPRAEGVGN